MSSGSLALRTKKIKALPAALILFCLVALGAGAYVYVYYNLGFVEIGVLRGYCTI